MAASERVSITPKKRRPHVHHLSGDVGRVVAREEDDTGGAFNGLSGSTDSGCAESAPGIKNKARHLLVTPKDSRDSLPMVATTYRGDELRTQDEPEEGRTYQWSEDRTGADRVDTDTLLLDNLVRNCEICLSARFPGLMGSQTRTCAGESHYSALGGGVIHKLRVSDERVDTGVVDNTGSPGHHRNQRLRKVKDGVDVGLEYVFPLFIGQVEDGFDLVLSTGVVEEDVDFAVEDLLGLFRDGMAFLLVAQVGGDGFKFRGGAVGLEVLGEVVHVLLFFLDIVQEEGSAFVGTAGDVSFAASLGPLKRDPYSQEDCRRSTNARIGSCITDSEPMFS